jgi:GMP synthase PP-ATPase subunit
LFDTELKTHTFKEEKLGEVSRTKIAFFDREVKHFRPERWLMAGTRLPARE